MNTRNRSIVFEGLVVNVEQMEVEVGNKGWHTFQVIRHPGGVAVLPLHEDGTITLIRQLRPSAGVCLLEVPAGRRDQGEEPELCGLRELVEETGLAATGMEYLGILHTSPGVMDEIIHLYLATGLTQRADNQEAFEDIETVRMPFEEALQMAGDGRITDSKTITALFRAERKIR